MLHSLPRFSVRSSLYVAVLAANTGLMPGYAPLAFAAPNQALEEVIVTARKREESVQEVPIAVSAFSGEQLREAGISNVKDMALQVPGMSIDSGSIAQVWIRGIGQRDTNSRIDGPTGIYLDGIYMARKEGQLLDVFDAESIQVLRGPQGTLFGKNTTAGALVISTRKPTNEFGGEISTRLGNFDRRDAKLMVNLPLIENKLLSKVTLASVKRDGYQTNIVDDSKMASEDRLATNLQLRWLASDSVTVDTFLYASKVREVAPSEIGRLLTKSGFGGQDSLYANSLWPGDTRPVWFMEYAAANPAPGFWDDVSPSYKASYDRVRNLGDYDVASNSANHFNIDNYLAGVNIDWDINDSLTFKSITGYGHQRVGPMSLNSDNDGTPENYQMIGIPNSSTRKQMSQEFQLNGEAFDQRLSYTAGLFGMVEKMDDYNASAGLPNGIFFPPNPLAGTPAFVVVSTPNAYSDSFKQENTTLAAFFQGSYDVTEYFQATAGVRWTSENRDITLNRLNIDEFAFRSALANAGILANPFDPRIDPAMLASDPFRAIANLFPVDQYGFQTYPLTALAEARREKKWIELSPMASLKFTLPDNWLGNGPIDNSMLYFTYSEGFKAGSFDVLGSAGLTQLDPETLKNFEVGFKIDAFDRSLRLNVAAYLMKYDNMQLIQVIPDPSNGRTTVAYTNASKSEIQGVEVELMWQPVQNMLISAGASYNDYDYKDYKAQQLSTYHAYTQQPAPVADRTGEPFAEVPSVTANLAVQYKFELPFGSLTPRLQANYVGERYMGLDAGAGLVKKQSTLDSYTLLDARLTFRTLDERIEVALYANNVTDELYYDGAASVGDSVGVFPVVSAPPRMYGLEASYRFGSL